MTEKKKKLLRALYYHSNTTLNQNNAKDLFVCRYDYKFEFFKISEIKKSKYCVQMSDSAPFCESISLGLQIVR